MGTREEKRVRRKWEDGEEEKKDGEGEEKEWKGEEWKGQGGGERRGERRGWGKRREGEGKGLRK